MVLHNLEHGKQRPGFTLPELIMVMAIICIVAGISIPSLLHWLPNIRLKAAARELYANMHRTKTQAIKRNKNWAIIFDTANNMYHICSNPGADMTWASMDDNTVEKSVELNKYRSGVTYGFGSCSSPPANPVTYTNKVLVFNPRGTGNAGYVYLDHEKHTDSLRVGTLTSGSVRIARWLGGDWE